MKGVKESFEFLEKNKISLAKWKIAENEEDLADFSAPFYLKVDLIGGGHKTEEKAVLRCNNLDEAEKNFRHLKKHFKEAIVVMEAVEGVEMILGLKEDAVFGKLLLIGFGGINVSVLKDIQFRALPVTRKEVYDAVHDLKFYDSLVQRKKYAVERFIDLAFNVSKLDCHELDLNPVIITENDAFVVDARLE